MSVESEIAQQLDSVATIDSPNRMSVKQLKQDIIDYLAFNDTELSRFPDLAGKPHWNLWMVDARSSDAVFVVVLFLPDGIEFVCGTGCAFEIKTFAETEFPQNPSDVLSAIIARFSANRGVAHFGRREAETWIGRRW